MAREFSAAELATFNGQDGSPCYLAVRGQVFDVTSAASFYGPGGPYEIFAGKECARALAMMKIEAAECNDVLSDCTDKQLQTLQDWVTKFTSKYPVVGKVSGSAATSPPARTPTKPTPSPVSPSLTVMATGAAVACVLGVAVYMTWSKRAGLEG